MIKRETVRQCKRDSDFYCYNGVLGYLEDGRKITAWIELKDGRESLFGIFDDGGRICVYEGKYILSPVVAAGEILFSAPDTDGSWPLYSAKCNGSGFEVKRIGTAEGRIASIRGETRPDGKAAWIVYACRTGKKTRIYAARFDGTGWSADIPVTAGEYNAYDPHIAASEDGLVYCIYTAYIHGSYHILMQKLDHRGKLLGGPDRIDDQGEICYWPSVAPRRGGGVWISWCVFEGLEKDQRGYLRHTKYQLRKRAFFAQHKIYAGVYTADGLFAPYAPRHTVKPGVLACPAGFIVGNSDFGKQSQIFEMPDGSVHILFRKYTSSDQVLYQPSIGITSLADDGWSDPEIIVPKGFHEESLSFLAAENRLVLAATEDHRVSGWDDAAEYFDQEHPVRVVKIEVGIECRGRPSNQLVERKVPHFAGDSLEEDDFITPPEADEKVIWGQTHKHSDISVCIRHQDQNPDFNYRFYQDVKKADFGGITDHCYNQWRVEQHLNHKLADYYYFEGQFIAFPAYEWTAGMVRHEGGPFGNVNPICLDNEPMEFLCPVDAAGRGASLTKLWAAYAGRKIITIPHHTADEDNPYNWDFYDADAAPVAEIFQDYRGQCEQPQAPGDVPSRKQESGEGYVVAALRRGCRLGFIGGGDHRGMALAGAVVKELTREALYAAFTERRTFASTGARAYIKMTANHAPMGSVVACDRAEVELLALTGSEMKEIQLVCNGETAETVTAVTNSFLYCFCVHRKTDRDFVYIRILLKNGEIFWSSPVWLVRSI